MIILFSTLKNHFVPRIFADSSDPIGGYIPNNTKFGNLEELANGAFKYFIELGMVILFLIFAYAGFLYLTSGGNTDQTRKAINAMVWSVIGLIIMITAYTLVKFVFPEIFTTPNNLL